MILYVKGRISTPTAGNCFQFLGHLNVTEGIVRNENRLGIVREYKTKGIPDNLLTTARVQQEKRKKRRANISSPYKWLK
jgi:hypothetical protein